MQIVAGLTFTNRLKYSVGYKTKNKHNSKGKGKAVPLEAWSGPEVSRMMVRLSAFRTGRLYPQ